MCNLVPRVSSKWKLSRKNAKNFFRILQTFGEILNFFAKFFPQGKEAKTIQNFFLRKIISQKNVIIFFHNNSQSDNIEIKKIHKRGIN